MGLVQEWPLTHSQIEPTVFGNSLETLSRLTGSIRLTKGVSELKDADKARGNAKEVMRLIGWLMDKGSAEVSSTWVESWPLLTLGSRASSLHRETMHWFPRYER
jgi:hypothetical protein